MASPQKENGYTPIAHEIIEALVRVKMSGSEWQYVMCVFRKTYGWNKKEDWCTNSQIVVMTGMGKERVSEAKSRLVARNIVTENRNKISFQKDYSKWKELRKSVSKVTDFRISELRKSVHTKETITKDKIGDKSPESMGWKQYNENAHSDDIPSIGDDGEIEKPKEKPKRHYKEVYELFKTLGPIPLNWNVNTTQQKCAENLYTERGVENIKNALEYYKEHKGEEYLPEINSPHDLDTKWSKLYSFKKKNG
jgi:phage replication O-like protein O